MNIDSLISWIQVAVVFGTVIMYGCCGEILTEKSGNLNLGIPGTMFLGGISSLAAAFFYENACTKAGIVPNPVLCILIAFVAAFAAGALGGFIYSFLTTTLRANQNVTGLTLTIFGAGMANFFGGSLNKLAGGVGQISISATSDAFRTTLPFVSKLTENPDTTWEKIVAVFAKIFLSYGFLAYLAIAVAIVMAIFLKRSRKGLNLRAVGENPATADAAGINVTKYKYLATCIGCGIAGLGGLYYVVDYTKGTWANDGTIETLGWLAVALVIFTTWKPLNAIWGSYLFGLLYWMYLYTGLFGLSLSRSFQSIFKMLPYVVTMIVLILTSIRKKRENQPPASLGLPYFREER